MKSRFYDRIDRESGIISRARPNDEIWALYARFRHVLPGASDIELRNDVLLSLTGKGAGEDFCATYRAEWDRLKGAMTRGDAYKRNNTVADLPVVSDEPQERNDYNVDEDKELIRGMRNAISTETAKKAKGRKRKTGGAPKGL